MIVAIHQPNIFPWIGYFAKILYCDVFVVLDDAQFTKQGYINRVQMNGIGGPWWLTIPVMTSGRFGQLVSETQIHDKPRWRDKILKRVRQEYKKAPYFMECFQRFEACMKSPSKSLCEVNINSIRQTLAMLRISRKIVQSSQFGLKDSGTQRLVDLVGLLKGTAYLSGTGAVAYQDDSLFHNADLDTKYLRCTVRKYPQIHGEFQPGLSVWDALFNIGPKKTRTLIEESWEMC